jgi:hypothetical protein
LAIWAWETTNGLVTDGGAEAGAAEALAAAEATVLATAEDWLAPTAGLAEGPGWLAAAAGLAEAETESAALAGAGDCDGVGVGAWAAALPHAARTTAAARKAVKRSRDPISRHLVWSSAV